MKLPHKNTSEGFFFRFKGLYLFLVGIILLRIFTYFMLWEEVAITQLFKAVVRIILTSALIIYFLIDRVIDKRPSPKLQYKWPIVLYISYLLLGIASFLWSTSISQSLLQWIMDFESFVFAVFFMLVLAKKDNYSDIDIFKLNKVLAPAITLIALWFLIGKFTDPDRFYRLTHGGEVARLGGFIINPNELGMLLVVGIACLLPLILNKEKYSISVILSIALMLYLLVLTGSRSSFFAMLLAVMLYALKNPAPIFKIGITLAVIVSIPLVGYNLFVKQGNVDEVMSATGRLPFWKDLLTYNFPREPFFGYGYMRIDYSDKFESLNAYAGAMTHNTFLQVLLGLGLVGLVLVLSQLAAFFYSLIKCQDNYKKQVTALIMIPLLINSFTEFGIFGETNYGILFYLFILFDCSLEPKGESSRIHEQIKTHDKQQGLPNRFIPSTRVIRSAVQ